METIQIINKVFCGDCANVLKTFPDECIDLVITSPPYDSMRTYNGFEFDFEKIAKELSRVLKYGGVIVWVVNDQTIKGSETLTSFKQALFFKESLNLNVHDTMIYSKAGFSNPSLNRYHQVWEFMFILSKGIPKTFNPIMDRPNIWKGKTCFGENTSRKVDGTMQKQGERPLIEPFGKRYNIWEIKTAAQENICKQLKHPAMFPFQLAVDHIFSWSNEGDIVMDPMMGSGTTIFAAKATQRKYVGIEISEQYFEEVKKSLVNNEQQLQLNM